jgi:hypothetical protein
VVGGRAKFGNATPDFCHRISRWWIRRGGRRAGVKAFFFANKTESKRWHWLSIGSQQRGVDRAKRALRHGWSERADVHKLEEGGDVLGRRRKTGNPLMVMAAFPEESHEMFADASSD